MSRLFGEPAAVPAPPDVGAVPESATRTASGLAYRILEPGVGDDSPQPDSVVVVEYVGWTADGRTFDSSAASGGPATLRLDELMAGWIEGLQLMHPGQKNRLWIPEALAFAGEPGLPEGMVVFDVKLVEFRDPPPPIPAPSDVAAPPDDATRTPSGLAYKVLRAGTGSEHPGPLSAVEVHQTMWTPDGTMHHTTAHSGAPVRIFLNNTIEGYREGVQTMVVGEKTRFWIPESLAFKISETAPRSRVVFDVELLAIHALGPAMRPPERPVSGDRAGTAER